MTLLLKKLSGLSGRHFLSVISVAFLLAACDAPSVGGGGGRVGYVNVQQVISDSEVGKDLTRQLKDYSNQAASRVGPERKRLGACAK